MNNWIDVSKKRPSSHYEKCLVFTNSREMYLASYYQGDWYELNTDRGLYKVTHWMPLPNEPLKKEGLETVREILETHGKSSTD